MGNPRQANGHRRAQLRRRILTEENFCGICGSEIDKSLKTPHPYSAEVDEIIPISRGGDPLARGNTQLAHRICNQRKSNKMPGDDGRTNTIKPLPNSQDW